MQELLPPPPTPPPPSTMTPLTMDDGNDDASSGGGGGVVGVGEEAVLPGVGGVVRHKRLVQAGGILPAAAARPHPAGGGLGLERRSRHRRRAGGGGGAFVALRSTRHFSDSIVWRGEGTPPPRRRGREGRRRDRTVPLLVGGRRRAPEHLRVGVTPPQTTISWGAGAPKLVVGGYFFPSWEGIQ